MNPQEGTVALPSNTDVTIMEIQDINADKNFKEIFETANARKNDICPIRDIIGRLSNKWTLLAIYAMAGYGTLRFNELKHKIGDISQRMLTVTLRNLENDGLIIRKIYAEVPPRVEYQLSDMGKSLALQVIMLIDWANANGEKIVEFRK